MSGRITRKPKPLHECEPGSEAPWRLDIPMGTIWTCDDCGDEWMWIPSASLALVERGGAYWVRDPGIPERRPSRWKWRKRR